MSTKLLTLFGKFRLGLTVPLDGKKDPESTLFIQMANLQPLLPQHWREDAGTPQEWFIRLGRSLGFHIGWDETKLRFDVRLIKDNADAATVAWPGRSNISASERIHGREWNHEVKES